VQAKVDELEFVLKTGYINGFAFRELKEQRDFAAVQIFFEKAKLTIEQIDREMTKLCLEDETALRRWAERMPIIQRCLDTVERNLPFVNHRLFEWDNVTQAIGTFDAFRVGAQQTIALNTPPKMLDPEKLAIMEDETL
jgi:hypothetical protein